MNKSFVVLDKTNNMQKNASTIVKFKFEEKEYLIYSIDENEQNKQIFVSKLTLNSEGKYFIDNISDEEKNKLSNIVYNIVILTPTNAKKGSNPSDLIKDMTEKCKVTFSLEIPDLTSQEYHSNCSIAITGKEFVDEAVKFYNENIKSQNIVSNENNAVPTWSIPSMTTTPPANVITPETINEVTPAVKEPEVNAVPQMISIPNESITANAAPVTPVVTPSEVNATPNPTVSTNVETPENLNIPNPQAEKLGPVAVVSDPSLAGITGDVNLQPNVGKKNAGFARNKYIVIGTICLVVAIITVVVAYFLIQNKINGA